MNLSTHVAGLGLSDIDFTDMGAWPRARKLVMALLVACSVILFSYLFLFSGLVHNLEAGQQKEQELRFDYQTKYGKALHLELYQQQRKLLENTLAVLLKQLPANHETPGMLDDISFAATAAGLSLVRIHWLPEKEHEFYTELPLQIEVIGDYHQIGHFVSEIARLPRIVSVYDFTLQNTAQGHQSFSVIAKTYRYKELHK